MTSKKTTKQQEVFDDNQFRIFIESATDMMNICDADLNLVYVNQSMCKILEYSAEELLGKHVSYIYRETDKKKRFTKEIHKELVDKGVLNYQSVWLSKGGRKIHGEIKVVARYDKNKNFAGSSAVFRDITKTKQTLEKLNDREDKHRKLVELMPDAILIHCGGIIQFANSSAVKLFDAKTKKNLIGKKVIDFVHPDYRNIVKKRIGKIIDKSSKAPLIEEKLLTLNGKVFDAEVTAIPIKIGNRKCVQVVSRNITERKKTEEKIKFLSTFVEQSSEGMAIANLEGDLIYVNDAWCNMHNYSNQDELIGKNLSISHSTEQINNDVIPFNNKVLKYGSHKGEVGHITKEGKEFPTLMVTTLLKDKNNKPFAFAGVAKDITDINNAYKALKESEEKHRNLVELSPMCILIHSKGIIQYVNPAAVIFFEAKSKDDLIGKIAIDVVHPDDRQKALERISQLIHHNIIAPAAEEKLVTIKGNTVYADVSASPIILNGENAIQVVAQDITERKQAEERLTLLNRSIEQSPVSVLVTDKKGNIEYANKAFCNISGYHIDEVIGKNPRILKSGHQPKEFYKKLWDTILSGNTWNGEMLNKTKSGKLYWENVIISPVINDSGNITHFVSVKENTTEIKKMIEDLIAAKKLLEENEHNLKQQNEEYESLNEELLQANEELLSAKKHAEESDKLKSAFLANVSHEIRTPINGILGFADLLKTKQTTENEKKEYLDIIEKSGFRMLDTINDIIDISKIESGQVFVNYIDIDLNEILNDLYRFFKQEANKKGIELILHKSKSSNKDVIGCDLRMLESILTNLIKNAIKFTKKGHIEFGYEIVSGEIQFFVKDTGIGISKGKQLDVFNRFVQEEQGYKRQFEGSGLGLSISKAYVDLLEGRIWLNSELGKGSEFYFAFPYKQGTKSTKQFSDDGFLSNRKAKKLNILIADDEDTTYSLLNIIMDNYSNKIFRAKSGTEAISIVKDNPDIDIVFMDIKMPIMDGYEATQKIRKFNKDVIIIAQTAYAFSDDRAKALDSGCNHYISKPIDKNLLLSIISEHFTS